MWGSAEFDSDGNVTIYVGNEIVYHGWTVKPNMKDDDWWWYFLNLHHEAYMLHKVLTNDE